MFTENPEDFIYNSSIGVHAVSPEGIVVYANKCELEVLGYTKSEYVGHHVSEFQFDKSCLEQMMIKLAKFEPFSNFPAMVCGKHKMKYILYSSNVYVEGGEFVHTRCFGNEISEPVSKSPFKLSNNECVISYSVNEKKYYFINNKYLLF